VESKATDWRQRAQELELELHAVQDKLERARVRRTAVLERLQRYEHTHLDSTVLAHLLPARAASWRDRPPDASAIERHTRHLAASEAYAAQLAGGAQPSEAADHVAIDGLEFWVPQDRRIPGRLADDLLKGYSMAPGSRVRPTAELSEALGYLGDSFTDLLVYRRHAA
jgi:hypothetical protein